MVDAGMGGGRDGGLRMVGDSEAGFSQHGEVVGTVSYRQGVVTGEAQAVAEFDEGCELRLASEDRLLDLSGQRLGDEGVKEIVAKREAAPLRWLGLADNWLTPEGARMLVAAKHLTLHHLDVRRNNLAPSHLAALRERFPDAVVLG